MKYRSAFRAGCARLAASIAFLLLCAAPLAAQVLFDSASNATPATVSAGNPIVVQWNHTTGLAKKPYIVVSVGIKRNGGAQTVTSVQYGSEAGGPKQNLTLLNGTNNGTIARAELWGGPGPIGGVHQITVTVANAGGQNTVVTAGAKSFSNVFQSASTGTAVGAAATSTTPTVNVTNSPFDYVVDAVAFNGNNALTAGAGQTNPFNVTSAAPVFSGAGSIETGTQNLTMSWTAGASQAWAIAAVPLQSAVPQILFDAASNATVTSAANPIVLSW